MPELHKLTPALGVLQDRGQRVAIVTDGRMSGASGKVPAAIHVTPEAALGGPLSPGPRRRPDHRRRGAPGVLDLDGAESSGARRRTGARARRARSGPAPAASCSRRSGPPSARPTRAPACSRRTTPRSRRCPLSSPPESLLDLVPVIPVVVVDDVADGRAAGPGAGRRRPAGDRADPAHPGRAGRDPGDRRRGAGDPGRRGHDRHARAGQAGARRRRAVPGLAGQRRPRCSRAMADTGLPFLPGTATVSEVLAVLEAGLHGDEVLPGRGVRRRGVPDVDRVAGPAGAVLPDRRDHRGHRAGVPRPAERRLRRRLLAHPGRRRSPPATGPASSPWPAKPHR